MSAITSNMASILLPSYSSTPSKHGASCNCSTCSSNSSSGGSGSSTSTTGSQGAGGANNTSQAASAATPRDAQGKPLSPSQQNEVAELKKTDTAVRKHEQAHLSAAGGYARSGIVLNFKVGPDGKQYAVGGHVDIDTSVVKGNPTATIAKMQTVQRAALAPADPSAQDVHVAAEAAQQAGQARAQEAQQQQASNSGGSSPASNGTRASTDTAANAGTGTTTGTASAPGASQKAGPGLKLSIAAKYGKSSPATAASSSSFGGSLDLVG